MVSLGAACTPSSTVCANGAQCYAVNSMLIPLCGNFQWACTSDVQCTFKARVSGSCSGILSSSAASSTTYNPTSTSTSTSTSQPASTSLTGTLSLGAACTPSSTVCTNGAQCYAVNSMLIPRCGSFQAECISIHNALKTLARTDSAVGSSLFRPLGLLDFPPGLDD
jgi:hypothetical protein